MSDDTQWVSMSIRVDHGPLIRDPRDGLYRVGPLKPQEPRGGNRRERRAAAARAR